MLIEKGWVGSRTSCSVRTRNYVYDPSRTYSHGPFTLRTKVGGKASRLIVPVRREIALTEPQCVA